MILLKQFFQITADDAVIIIKRIIGGASGMKKWLSLLLTLALLFGTGSLHAQALEDPKQPFASEEEALAYLAQCAEEKMISFTLPCTQDLYNILRDDNFSGIRKLEIKSGIADASIRYSYTDYYFEFSSVRYEKILWAECVDEEAVQQALKEMAGQKAKKFTLLLNQDLASSFDRNSLYAMGARCGMAELSLRTMSGIIQVDGVDYSKPYAYAEDEASFLTAVESMAQENAKQFYIALDQAYFESIRSDYHLKNRLLAAAPLESYSLASNYYSYTLIFSDVVYSDVPRILCNTEEELIQAIRNMGASGNKSFNLILSENLYDTVYEGYFKKLHALEAEAGMVSSDLSYSISSHTLLYTNADIRTDVVKLSTVQDVEAYVAARVTENAKEITLFCSDEVYERLMEGINPFFSLTGSMAPIYDIAAQAGLFKFSVQYSSSSHIITFMNVVCYPGTNILRAVKSGDGSALTDREQQTWQAAEDMAEACKAETPLETARNIHDSLAMKIVYTEDESTDEDDTAIGALLNGEANCDGYADVFFLVGTLAGLEVRCQHGDSYSVGYLNTDFLNQITHMWNLVRLDGTWRLVDVTWDDGEEGVNYTWFNLGYDRASRMHIWNEDVTVPLDPATDLACRPENEYLVADEASAAAAIEDAAARGFHDFCVIYADEASAEGHQDLFKLIQSKASGSFTYSWNERMLMLTINRISLK